MYSSSYCVSFCNCLKVHNELPYAIEVFYMANAGTESVSAGFVEPGHEIRLPCLAAVMPPYEIRFKPQMAGYICFSYTLRVLRNLVFFTVR